MSRSGPANRPDSRNPVALSEKRDLRLSPVTVLSDYSFQDIKNASLYEPRITYIKDLLESLLTVVDLERDGNLVKVDGFRLKNLKDWRVPSSCDPRRYSATSARRCNAGCLFCYNRGNPPPVALGNLRRANRRWKSPR